MRDFLAPRWNQPSQRLFAEAGGATRLLRYGAAAGAGIGVALLVLCGGLAIAMIDGQPRLCGVDWPLVSEGVDGVWKLALVAGVAALIVAVLRGLALRAAYQEAHAIAAKLRRGIHAQGLRQGGAELLGDREESPRMLFTDDCRAIRDGFSKWASGFPFVHVAVFALIALASAADPWWALLGVLLLGAAAWSLSAVQRYAASRAQQTRDEAKRTETLLLERLDLAAVTAALMLVDEPGEPFVDTLQRHESVALRADTAQAGPASALWLALGLGGVVLLLVIAASAVSDPAGERSSPAAAVVVTGALAAAAVMLSHAPRLEETVRRVNESALRIATYLNREPAFRMAPQAQPLPRLARAVEFQDVTLADLRGQRLLDRVSTSIPAGSTAAIVADDRRTARAALGLMIRLFDPAAGSVRFDGRDLREATLDTSRGQTAVAGDRLLFTGTLRQNITCDDSTLDPEQLDRAVELAGLPPLLATLAQGADTIIGGQAVHLDNLAAFRVTLARALARNPALLIVAEPHLPKAEDASAMNQLLDAAGEGRTLVILPARTATLRWASKVLVFEQGRLAAEGQHTQLVQQNAGYRHLVYTQFTSRE